VVDIQLNFINNSNDVNNSEIVIFQKNVATDFDEVAIAWTVIKNCGQGENHPFTYSQQVQISSSDAWGNFTRRLDAPPGTAFSVVMDQSGDTLRVSGQASSASEIELLNGLEQGAVGAYVYRSGRVIAAKTGIAPGQKAVFQFKPIIWVGIVSETQEGESMNSAVISAVNTELTLLGLASADIVLTGGGAGPHATAFQFNLENIVMA
jgi:hypothetical protein